MLLEELLAREPGRPTAISLTPAQTLKVLPAPLPQGRPSVRRTAKEKERLKKIRNLRGQANTALRKPQVQESVGIPSLTPLSRSTLPTLPAKPTQLCPTVIDSSIRKYATDDTSTLTLLANAALEQRVKKPEPELQSGSRRAGPVTSIASIESKLPDEPLGGFTRSVVSKLKRNRLSSQLIDRSPFSPASLIPTETRITLPKSGAGLVKHRNGASVSQKPKSKWMGQWRAEHGGSI